MKDALITLINITNLSTFEQICRHRGQPEAGGRRVLQNSPGRLVLAFQREQIIWNMPGDLGLGVRISNAKADLRQFAFCDGLPPDFLSAVKVGLGASELPELADTWSVD